jgi:hypothetical protein
MMKSKTEVICQHFRREDSHLPGLENQEFWQDGEPASVHYWCLKTMTVTGPDTESVNPDECHHGRGCFLLKDI